MRESISFEGAGVHSGRKAVVTVHPSTSGLTMEQGGVTWRISPTSVLSTQYRTQIGTEQAKVSTVEHLLGALAGSGIVHAHIEADEEIPILDGSGYPFWSAFQDLFQEQGMLPGVTPIRPLEAREGEAFVRWSPGPTDALEVRAYYDIPSPESWSWSWKENFLDIVQARTFGDISWEEPLRSQGFALGSSQDNTLLFSRDKLIGPPLRYPNEPMRHKVFDAIGDLYILGRRPCGILELHRAGHRLHHELIKGGL